MFKILIDTTDRFNRSVKLAEFADGVEKEVVSKCGEIDIASATREILKMQNLKISDIDEFISNPGPGSFTGIKIGVTFTNVLNWVMGKKKVENLQIPEYGRPPNISKRK